MIKRSLRAFWGAGLLGLLAAASTLAGACSSSYSGDAVDPSVDAGMDGTAQGLDSGGFQLDAEPELQNWLLSVGNASTSGNGMKHALAQISILPGDLGAIRDVICPDLVFGGAGVSNDVVSSLTFYNDVLYAVGASGDGDASRAAASLYRIDPCGCTATRVGVLGADLGLVGSITSYGNRAIYGVASTNNSFFSVDPATGAGTVVTSLAVPFGASGLTWSGEERDTLWGIESNSDSLYELNAKGEFVHDPLKLDYDFAGLGMEYHPGAQKLFACSNSKILEVNTSTGHVTVGPALGWDGGCANMAAPFGPNGCIKNVH